MRRPLVLTGGLGHPPEASVPALQALLGPHLDVMTDIHQGLGHLDREVHDLLVVNALAFEMRAARYDHLRDDHAFHLEGAGRRAIESWVASGGPILALHCAVISFDSWPRWAHLVGGAWNWERSWHPPLGSHEVVVTWPGREATRFTVTDERYSDLWIADDVHVVATCDAFPVAWLRQDGDARVACCVLGHDARSLENPAHRDLQHDLVSWLLEDACPT